MMSHISRLNKLISICTFLLAFCLSAGSQIFKQDLENIAGKYIRSSGFTGYRITLNIDGTYENQYFTDCCQFYPPTKGNYSISRDIIHFVEIEKGKTKKEFEMQLVRWGDRIYLVDDIFNFAASVNFDIEPRLSVMSRNYLTEGVYLRRGDEVRKVAGIPSLSGNGENLISAPVIEVNVTKVEVRDKHKSVDINKGSEDGVLIGMCFVQKGVNPDESTVLWVVAVEKNKATLKNKGYYGVPDYKVGDVLSNKSRSNTSEPTIDREMGRSLT